VDEEEETRRANPDETVPAASGYVNSALKALKPFVAERERAMTNIISAWSSDRRGTLTCEQCSKLEGILLDTLSMVIIMAVKELLVQDLIDDCEQVILDDMTNCAAPMWAMERWMLLISGMRLPARLGDSSTVFYDNEQEREHMFRKARFFICYYLDSLLPALRDAIVIENEVINYFQATQNEALDRQAPAASPAVAALSPFRTRGRPGDKERHIRISDIVSPYGEQWDKHLEEIAAKADSEGIAPRQTPNWQETWTATLAVKRDLVKKAIQDSLNATQRNTR
jgi:hypothetical protein